MHMEANGRGRDFVVGDIHGRYKTLVHLLIKVRFDPDRDRLFSVGDLINKGPNSRKALTLLNEPWFYAVRGNHEERLVHAFHASQHPDRLDQRVLRDFRRAGGDWALTEDGARFDPVKFDQSMLGHVRRLPVVLVVGEGAERFNVVHAQIPAGMTDASLVAGAIQDRHIELEMIWSRTIMGTPRGQAPMPRTRPGLSPTFCGHTPQQDMRVLVRDGHTCLDTFVSHKGGMLTMVEVRTRRFYRSVYLDGGPE